MMRDGIRACLLGLLVGELAYGADEQTTQAESYQRCAACHLPTGEGVPGAFPPLRGRIANIAASPEGRIYLIAVVNAGLMGNITVGGTPYLGVMPAQGPGFDAQWIRDALNYSVQVLDGDKVRPDWQPFSTDEVQRVISDKPATSAMENGRLRQDLLAKYPGLQ